MQRLEERRLIERAATGDRDAAEGLIRAHQVSLYAYMLRMSGRPEIAEDIVQDAFVRALTNLDRFDFRFRFSTWLFTIAKRLYVNQKQKLQPKPIGSGLLTHPSTGDDPDCPTIDAEVLANARASIDAALASLNDEQREIVALFYQLNWSINRIAEYLTIPAGTVKSHLHRARARMRAVLSESTVHAIHVGEVWS